jgi:hypothetical protein
MTTLSLKEVLHSKFELAVKNVSRDAGYLLTQSVTHPETAK